MDKVPPEKPMKEAPWFKHIGKVLLGAIALGMYQAFTGAYQDFANLKANDKIQNKKISAVEKKVDDLHWYLIRKPGVKIPKSK